MNNNNIIDLTTTEELKELSPNQKGEFTLYVTRVDQTIKTRSGRLLFKFLLSNKTGTTVHVRAWNEEIPRVETVAQLNNILHFENLDYTPANRYNGGNFPAEFTINKYSVVECLGKIDFTLYEIDPPPTNDHDFPLIELSSLGDQLLPTYFKTTGYLKTDLNIIKSENKALTKAVFVITDGDFKLDVTVHQYTDDLKIEKGSKLFLVGSAQFYSSDQVYLRVEGIDGVKVMVNEEKKTLNWLLKGKKLISSKFYGANPSKKQRT